MVEPVSPLSPFLTLKSIEETSIQVDVGESSRVVWPAVLASGSVSSLKSRLIIMEVVEEMNELKVFFYLSFFEWFNLEKHMVLVKWTLPRWGFSYSYTTCSSRVGCCS